MGTDKLVTIAINNYARAEMIKARLEMEGIKCYLKNVNLIQSAISSGVKVRIHESDLEKATQILVNEKISEEIKSKIIVNPQCILPVTDEVNLENYKVVFEFAYANNFKINLLYILSGTYYDSVPIADNYSANISLNIPSPEQEKEAQKKLKDLVSLAKKIAKETNSSSLNIKGHYQFGDYTNAILGLIEEENVGLVILPVSTNGDDGFSFSGHNHIETVENSPVPVMVIPENCKVSQLKDIKNIAYITDFDETDFVNIKKLIKLIDSIETNIHCVHIGIDENPAYTNTQMDGLKHYFSSLHPESSVLCENIESEDRANGIENYIQNKDIQLIALTYHKRDIITSFFDPSATKRLLFHTDIPFLIYHA